ncbi:MAG: peptide deformylase [Lachnospiraceae bacterium]|nr:peptide deformylase [Lachnospiraceae bacterium]
MALRSIRTIGDEILLRPSREVTELTPRLKELIGDMYDTLYEADGVGLAAVQVGVLRRIIVIDVGDGPITLINPRLLEKSGEQKGNEGCLSVPGKVGLVTRPNYVKILYYDENMQPQELEATELLARGICHELDHLEGELYVDRVEGELKDVEEEEEENEGKGKGKGKGRGRK